MMRTGLPLLGIELLMFVLFRSLTVLNVLPLLCLFFQGGNYGVRSTTQIHTVFFFWSK